VAIVAMKSTLTSSTRFLDGEDVFHRHVAGPESPALRRCHGTAEAVTTWDWFGAPCEAGKPRTTAIAEYISANPLGAKRLVALRHSARYFLRLMLHLVRRSL